MPSQYQIGEMTLDTQSNPALAAVVNQYVQEHEGQLPASPRELLGYELQLAGISDTASIQDLYGQIQKDIARIYPEASKADLRDANTNGYFAQVVSAYMALRGTQGYNKTLTEFYKEFAPTVQRQTQYDQALQERLKESGTLNQEMNTLDAQHLEYTGETISTEDNNIYWQSNLAKKTIQKAREVKDALQKIADGAEEETVKNLRDDLEQYGGTNDITFIFGDKTKGLVHIAERHGGMKTLLRVLDSVIDGKIIRYLQGNKTVIIEKNGYEAVLSLDENGKKKTWLLTGYDTKASPDAERQVRANLKATQHEPILSRQVLGAGLMEMSITPSDENVNQNFQGEGIFANGAYNPNRNLLNVFKTANESTFLHETSHWWLDIMYKAKDTNAEAKRIVDTIKTWAKEQGAKDWKDVQKKWARGADRYLMKCKAPNTVLAKTFQAFKKWLEALYKTFTKAR